MPFDENTPRPMEGEGDRWEGKPISKEALIACVRACTYLGTDAEKLIAEIESRNIAGFRISVPDAGTKDEITAQVADEPVAQMYDRYCGNAVRAALEVVLGREGLETLLLPSFPDTIRLKK